MWKNETLQVTNIGDIENVKQNLNILQLVMKGVKVKVKWVLTGYL